MNKNNAGLVKLGTEPDVIILVEQTIPLKDVRLSTTLSYPVKANLDFILPPDSEASEYWNRAILIPDKKRGMLDLAGNISVFKDAVFHGNDELDALVLFVETEDLPAVRRILNRESLPYISHLQTLYKLVKLYDDDGLLYYARKDNGSQEELVTFLAEALMVDEEEVKIVANMYWLERDDLMDMVYDGKICLFHAYQRAIEEDNNAE